jgi:hypothetical protein
MILNPGHSVGLETSQSHMPGHGGLPCTVTQGRMGLSLAARSGVSAARQARLHNARMQRGLSAVIVHRPCTLARLPVARRCLPHGAVMQREMRKVRGAPQRWRCGRGRIGDVC